MISAGFKKLDPDLFRKSLIDMAVVVDQLLKLNHTIFPYNCQTFSEKLEAALNFDTSYIKQKGLSEAVRLCFGKILDKNEQMSNWDKRPLRKSQIKYAGNNYIIQN